MNQLTIRLPKDISALVEANQISKEQLDAFVIATLKAWLSKPKSNETKPVAWENAFHESASDFAERFIRENQALYDELARR